MFDKDINYGGEVDIKISDINEMTRACSNVITVTVSHIWG